MFFEIEAKSPTKSLHTSEIEAINEAIVRVAKEVSPWVVSVAVFGHPQRGGDVESSRPLLGPSSPSSDSMFQSGSSPMGIGSGIILSANGTVLTNHHVIANAARIRLTLADGTGYRAHVLGGDAHSDLAVLKIEPPATGFVPARLGDSDSLRVGELVLALGNPYGYNHTVTMGIISALGRRDAPTRTGESYQDFIQTDAAVNPGNSGGPLVNLEGEVVGVNTLIITRSGNYQGISFAIPIRMAHRIARDLANNGRVDRGFLGVSIVDVDENAPGHSGWQPTRGARVDSVMVGSPAAAAGLLRHDVVTAVNGQPVEDASHLRNLVAEIPPGDSCQLRLWREGNRKILQIKLGSRPQK